jgi:AraC-like DNA-binding protein
VVLIAEATVTPGSTTDQRLSSRQRLRPLPLRLHDRNAASARAARLPEGGGAAGGAARPRRCADKLAALIEADRVYAIPGLTIGMLAERLGEREYKVRQIINSQLGFRNFNAFLNHYRVRDARRLLADPGQSTVGIAEVAYRLGYVSSGRSTARSRKWSARPRRSSEAAQQEQSLADSGIGLPHSKAR